MSSTSGLLVLVEEHQIILENTHLHLGFSRTEAGVWYLASLRRTIAGSKEWIKVGTQPLPLWQMRFLHESYLPPDASSRNRWDMRVQQEWLNVDAFTPARTAATVERQSEQVVLTILWEGIVLAGADETADVRVTVSLAANSAVSRWSAQIRTQGTHSSLWELRYPLIGDLVASEETTLIVPAGWGMGIKGAAQKADVYDGYYPSGWCVMQLICLTDGQETVYLAPDDKRAFFKRLKVDSYPTKGTISYTIVQYPDNMGSMRNSYATPYHVEVGVLPGDWHVAAKHYRAWALTAPWTAGGKIETKADTAQWIKENVLWANTNAMTPDAITDAVHDLIRFAQFFGVPTAVHWYSWHQIPFDDHYPEYFPAKPGFEEAITALHRVGIRVMPYINGRLWDPRTESWFAEEAASACTKDWAQKKYVESYASKVVLAAMCPTTTLWQSKISGIVERLKGEFDVDGVYVDQIGAAPPNLCFDRTHGHTSGGGDYWVRGYEQLLTQAKARGKAHGEDLILTTEDAAEAYGAHIDAFLMCNSTGPNLVPLYPMVYSGIFLTFGRYIFEEDLADPAAFRTKLGQMFLWGAQLGWMSSSFILKEQYAADAAFLRELAQTRAANQNYLAFGEMGVAPIITNKLPCIQTKWCMWNPDADFAIQPLMDVSMPAVETAAWRHCREYRWALFFVNMVEMPLEVTWSFLIEASEKWEAREQRTGILLDTHTLVNQIKGMVTVPPLSARVIELFRKS